MMSTSAPAGRPAEGGAQLNDDVVVEILQRLPTAAVLRSRAVCKAWQRMTSSAEFIAAHARRRRPMEFIFQRGMSGTLETIPLLASLDDEAQAGHHHHVPYPAYTRPIGAGGDWSGYVLIDSCDGLLLFQRDSDRKDFAVCNPVTQQWSMAPRVPGAYTVPTGFYVHGPSGEHRLLCLTADDQGGSHYVCSLEAAQARRLGQAWPWPLGNLYADLPVRYVNLDGKLHWLQHPKIRLSTDAWPPGAEGRRPTILAFDTVLETFRRIRRPPWKGDCCFLLEMDDGMLAMGDFHILRSVDIWVLRDYDDDESWTLRLRVDLPQQLLGSCWAMNAFMEGRSVILLGDRMRSWVGLYDVEDKTVLKRTQLATSSDLRIPLNVLLFKDTLERHVSIFTDSRDSTHPFSRKRKFHT